MREIPLSQEKVALVDDEDFELVREYKWHLKASRRFLYAETSTLGSVMLMHRYILDAPDIKHVDHINDDGLDNRRSNLRFCSAQQNLWNKRKQEGCSSQYKGVVWDRQANKWRTRIRKDDKLIHLGRFKFEEGAAAAYDRAAIELFGEFARLNFP